MISTSSCLTMCLPELGVTETRRAPLRRDLKLQYHGQFDSSRPSNGVPITGAVLLFVCQCSLCVASMLLPARCALRQYSVREYGAPNG